MSWSSFLSWVLFLADIALMAFLALRAYQDADTLDRYGLFSLGLVPSSSPSLHRKESNGFRYELPFFGQLASRFLDDE